jgi:hypothetical protein
MTLAMSDFGLVLGRRGHNDESHVLGLYGNICHGHAYLMPTSPSERINESPIHIGLILEGF